MLNLAPKMTNISSFEPAFLLKMQEMHNMHSDHVSSYLHLIWWNLSNTKDFSYWRSFHFVYNIDCHHVMSPHMKHSPQGQKTNNASLSVCVCEHLVVRSACFLLGLLSLEMIWGRASFCHLPPSLSSPSSRSHLLPSLSLSFFLYVKRLEHSWCWTVSNRFVCEGKASHSEYHNAILSLLVTLCPHPKHLREPEWRWETPLPG